MNHAEQLKSRIDKKDAVVGVIGLGYVGLPLADAFVQSGMSVIGFDVDPEKIRCLDAGENYLKHLGDDLAQRLADSKRFQATSDFDKLVDADCIIVCVPTPIGQHMEPDLSYVLQTAEQIGRRFRAGQLLVLESTTYPGTTRDEFIPAVIASAKANARDEPVPGENVFAAFSPEREDPGRKSHNTRTIPKLVGGMDTNSTEIASALYRHAVSEVVPVESAEVAEAAKILENVFRAVNIAMINEMKMLFDRMGIDVWKVVQAAATKPFGFMPFFPGPGLGGHCIPIDPFYLTWKAREYGLPTRFIELAGEINHRMPEWVVDRVVHTLNQRGVAVVNARVLIMGMAYKPNVDDVRETPSARIAELLLALGSHVDYHDPHVPRLSGMRHYPTLDMRSVTLTSNAIASYDLVLIATDHEAVDYHLLADNAKVIVDTRNAMSRVETSKAAIVKA